MYDHFPTAAPFSPRLTHWLDGCLFSHPNRRKVHPKKQSLNAYVVFKDEEGVERALERSVAHTHSCTHLCTGLWKFCPGPQKRNGDPERLPHPSGPSSRWLCSKTPAHLNLLQVPGTFLNLTLLLLLSFSSTTTSAPSSWATCHSVSFVPEPKVLPGKWNWSLCACVCVCLYTCV